MKRLWVRVSVIISGLILVILLTIVTASLLFSDTADMRSEDYSSMRMPFNAEKMPLFRRLRAPTHMVIIFIIIAFAGVGTGVWIGRGISRPISDLADAAKHLGSGDLSYRVVTKTRSQELIELTNKYGHLAKTIVSNNPAVGKTKIF